MIAITQNDESIKNETLSENNPDIQLFFEKQLKEFNEKISSLMGKRTNGSSRKKRTLSYDTKTSEHSELNKYINDSDWNDIENQLWWKIETFYNFHSGIAGAIYKVKEILKDLDPALELAQLGGDTLSTVSESLDGFPQVAAIVKGLSTVGSLLGLLRQTELQFNYSKNFIFTIFGEIIKVSKTRNIETIHKALQIAKESLDGVKSEWNIWLSLTIAKQKVSSSIDFLNGYIKIIAEQKKADENRVYAWGSSWY
ncbi:hypothetical protein FCM44_01370 [Mycoplasma bovis]|uniref:Conserved domain protein n=1 Tax=Mycoplasmopsis bovis (strain ATCC 25523 / DSM 22781 / NCTC 10131 / PG45) TaxID=289397 RepID=A0A454API3_MYCBG|nr:hypothetical protein [Mycoplasmopsis bovis]ADR24987.1 conserved domain protein [Mycoplasmopsis bovis PG45]MBT1368366.1 hypothetical protein [Mycoplasmopsis bovis]QLI75936.1 hypothetical protein H0I36_00460 [Mycoplasmopsis bovis]TKA60089.1 hypothetical protein MBOVb_6220 [Mycoplasmopsis bovis 1067]UTW26273.1 hypothetical protein L8F43_00740 [Mycoplasmopsis bovis]